MPTLSAKKSRSYRSRLSQRTWWTLWLGTFLFICGCCAAQAAPHRSLDSQATPPLAAGGNTWEAIRDLQNFLAATQRFTGPNGNTTDLLDSWAKGINLMDIFIRGACGEAQAERLLDVQQELQELIASVALSGHKDAWPLVLRFSLLHKGRSLDIGSQRGRESAAQRFTPDQQLQQKNHAALLHQLIQLDWANSPKESASELAQRRKQLVRNIQSLESYLGCISPAPLSRTFPHPDQLLTALASRLHTDSALVLFIRYRPLKMQSPDMDVVAQRAAMLLLPALLGGAGMPLPSMGAPESFLPPHYLGLLVRANRELSLVDLGPQDSLDAEAAQFLAVVRDPTKAPVAAAARLYERVLKPFAARLGGIRSLYVAADGSLNYVPFAALHDGSSYVGSRIDFLYLNSGRDLLNVPLKTAGGPPLIIAASNPGGLASPLRQPTGQAPGVEGLYARIANLAPLPYAEQEARQIAALLPGAQLALGAVATETYLRAKLRRGAAPRILHIASHGIYFAEEDGSTQLRGLRASAMVGAMPQRPLPTGPPTALPGMELLPSLSRTALLLHPPARAQRGADSESDGVLTGLELRELDLRGTQLAVLSACDSGLGAIKSDQGVYGLGRALLFAGAESVVMSLWRVADQQTAELMVAYYLNVLAGEPRLSALHKAAVEIQRRYPHPHYWAPFIGLGVNLPLHQ